MTTLVAILLAAVTPLYTTHNTVDGETQTMTNIQEWAASVVSGEVSIPNNVLAYTNGSVKTVGGTSILPKHVDAVSASEFAVPWDSRVVYHRYDTVSHGGKLWVASNDIDEDEFNESGKWIDLVTSTYRNDRSWLKWRNDWLDSNYAPRGGDVSFGSVSASSVSVGNRGTGTVSANLSGGATIGSGRTLAVATGASFTIGGSNFNAVVGNAIDAKVATATNAAVGQVHRIVATNGMSAVDGDLGIYDTNGWEYVSQTFQGLRYFLNYDGSGNPYWTANYKGESWDYHFKIRFVSGSTWHVVCTELDIDRTEDAGEPDDDTLYFRSPVGLLDKSAVLNPVRHGSIVPSYVKVAGRSLTNDVSLGTLTIQGQTYDGTSDKTINIEGMTGNAVVLTNGTAKTKDGTTVQAGAVGAISTNQLNSGMTWKSGSTSQMNGTLMVGNTGTLQANNTSKVWFINPDNVKVGSALTYSAADDLKAWIGHNAAIPFSQRYDSALSLRRYQVSPSGYGIGAYQFVGDKFYTKQWSDYMIYDDSGDSIQTWSLPWYLGQNYVPNTRKVNGQPLSSDVTIQTMDYPAMTNTVNAVKNLHYDPGLQVTWTNVISNGHIYYITVTNTNISTL